MTCKPALPWKAVCVSRYLNRQLSVRVHECVQCQPTYLKSVSVSNWEISSFSFKCMCMCMCMSHYKPHQTRMLTMPTAAVLSNLASSHYLCLFTVRVVTSEHTADKAVSMFHAAPHSCCVTATLLVDHWRTAAQSQIGEKTQREGIIGY